jgi:hypothetical protein
LAQAASDPSDLASREELSHLEDLVQRQPLSADAAREVLRRILFSQAGVDGSGKSLGDALTLLAKNPSNNHFAAIVLLRYLAINTLLPAPNATNQIVRSTVELCEGALPEIISFLKIDRIAQNYDKFASLCSCHNRICEILSPLRSSFGDLHAVVSARREILGRLNHSIVQKYAAPFNLLEARTAIESLFTKLQKVSSMEPTLLLDIEECNRTLSLHDTQFFSIGSFLICDHVIPFFETCKKILSDFLDTHRARFAATIVWGGSSSHELQRKYPLHEPGREIQIVVPLRNPGPGMATDVRITVEAIDEEVALGGETVILGNVLPGDFSVILDAMVIAPCSHFRQLLSVEWGEIGSPTRT